MLDKEKGISLLEICKSILEIDGDNKESVRKAVNGISSIINHYNYRGAEYAEFMAIYGNKDKGVSDLIRYTEFFISELSKLNTNS